MPTKITPSIVTLAAPTDKEGGAALVAPNGADGKAMPDKRERSIDVFVDIGPFDRTMVYEDLIQCRAFDGFFNFVVPVRVETADSPYLDMDEVQPGPPLFPLDVDASVATVILATYRARPVAVRRVYDPARFRSRRRLLLDMREMCRARLDDDAPLSASEREAMAAAADNDENDDAAAALAARDGLARLSGSPHIVQWVGGAVRPDPFEAFLVFEYCTYGSLGEWIHDDERPNFTMGQLLRILHDIAAALAWLHAHYIFHNNLTRKE